MPMTAQAAYIQIVERTNAPDPMVVVPNEVIINGTPVLCTDDPITVTGLDGKHEVVTVNLTLFVRRLVIEPLPKSEGLGVGTSMTEDEWRMMRANVEAQAPCCRHSKAAI